MTIPVTDTALDMEKKAIERCTQRNAFRKWLAWVYFCMFVMGFSVFYVSWCTNGLRNYIITYLELRNGTQTFELWQQPPVSLIYKIYAFNYTNIDDYQAYRADKLRVEEIGPFIYSETMSPVNVKIHENDTLSYQEKKSYQWIGGRSDNTIITVPNVLMMSSIAYVRDLNFAAQLGLTTLLSSLSEKPFIKQTANGFFWGYDNRLFDLLKPILILQQTEMPFEKFGMLAKVNGTSKDRITINTGTQDIRKLGMIEQINGQESRDIWGDKQCNKITGTDGSRFPPHQLEDNQDLYIYFRDMCRSIPFKYTNDLEYRGLPLARYKFSTDAFNFSDKQNKCYCQEVHGSKVCPPSGIFNISACVNNSPILVSFPHFYAADKSLLEEIDGLHPRQEEHEFYIDIYKNLAIPLMVRSRMQMNLEVRRAKAVPFLGRLKDGMILPLIWVEVSIKEFPDFLMSIIYRAHFMTTSLITAIQWGSIVFMVLSLCSLVLCLKKRRSEEHTDVQLDSLDQDKLLVLS